MYVLYVYIVYIICMYYGPHGPAAFQAVGLRARPKGLASGPGGLSGRGPQGPAAFQAVGLRAPGPPICVGAFG